MNALKNLTQTLRSLNNQFAVESPKAFERKLDKHIPFYDLVEIMFHYNIRFDDQSSADEVRREIQHKMFFLHFSIQGYSFDMTEKTLTINDVKFNCTPFQAVEKIIALKGFEAIREEYTNNSKGNTPAIFSERKVESYADEIARLKIELQFCQSR